MQPVFRYQLVLLMLEEFGAEPEIAVEQKKEDKYDTQQNGIGIKQTGPKVGTIVLRIEPEQINNEIQLKKTKTDTYKAQGNNHSQDNKKWVFQNPHILILLF